MENNTLSGPDGQPALVATLPEPQGVSAHSCDGQAQGVGEQIAPLLARKHDPRGFDGKPRNLPHREKDSLRGLLDAVEAQVAAMPIDERVTLLSACLNVSPINCAWDAFAMADIVYSFLSHDLAQVGTRPEGEDADAASFTSDAVAKPCAQGEAS